MFLDKVLISPEHSKYPGLPIPSCELYPGKIISGKKEFTIPHKGELCTTILDLETIEVDERGMIRRYYDDYELTDTRYRYDFDEKSVIIQETIDYEEEDEIVHYMSIYTYDGKIRSTSTSIKDRSPGSKFVMRSSESYTYTTNGKIESVHIKDFESNIKRVENYKYDSAGNEFERSEAIYDLSNPPFEKLVEIKILRVNTGVIYPSNPRKCKWVFVTGVMVPVVKIEDAGTTIICEWNEPYVRKDNSMEGISIKRDSLGRIVEYEQTEKQYERDFMSLNVSYEDDELAILNRPEPSLSHMLHGSEYVFSIKDVD